MHTKKLCAGGALCPCVFRCVRLPMIEGCRNYHQGLWTPRCRLRSHILVSPKGEFQNSAVLFPCTASRVGCAVAGARPQGIASASQVTRMLLLLSQAFRYIPVLFRISKFVSL